VEFSISTNGDVRPPFWFPYDRGRRHFFRSGKTYIYTSDSYFTTDRGAFDAALEQAEWTGGIHGTISWATWRRDVRAALREASHAEQ